ncbi:Oidioi.mRNA.OKI2018_I69.chr1.g1301.t1.cds [Oikopleura dioica]|uniref:Oidioi.mRNA.OKI2018_I69.chr1.g1301.t1.cds n=1 Tax=Oikopleura dioica TaxID=34765 RepID=A0ABN7SRA2_OIKDI|nr:Oidioi.mRNA.OKI2018_I69.chr1.g1301.t1.cds [Oikopleura dioica]
MSASAVTVNSRLVEECRGRFGYNEIVDGYTLEVPLGTCGLDLEVKEDLITFSTVVQLGVLPKKDIQGTIFFNGRVEFSVRCDFRRQASTMLSDLKGLRSHFKTYKAGSETWNHITQESSWDNDFKLTFHDETYRREISGKQFLGDRIYFQIEWVEKIKDNFPIVFYVESCTVTEKNQANHSTLFKKAVGKNRRVKIRVALEISKFKVRWSYRSFQFSTDADQELSLGCKVRFSTSDRQELDEREIQCENDRKRIPVYEGSGL